MGGYYRPSVKDTNPNWYGSFTEQIEQGEDPEDVIDQICELACGIKFGASDMCQKYAKHIHAHLIAAFKVGQRVANKTAPEP